MLIHKWNKIVLAKYLARCLAPRRYAIIISHASTAGSYLWRPSGWVAGSIVTGQFFTETNRGQGLSLQRQSLDRGSRIFSNRSAVERGRGPQPWFTTLLLCMGYRVRQRLLSGGEARLPQCGFQGSAQEAAYCRRKAGTQLCLPRD